MEMRSQRLITRAGVVRLRPLRRADVADWRAARLSDEHILRAVEPTGDPDWERGSSARAFRRVLRGARAAGAVCVAVATGRVSADDLRAAGAHTVLPDLTDPDALLAAVHASV